MTSPIQMLGVSEAEWNADSVGPSGLWSVNAEDWGNLVALRLGVLQKGSQMLTRETDELRMPKDWQQYVADFKAHFPGLTVPRLCPRTSHLTPNRRRLCYACADSWCVELGALGLDDTGTPLAKTLRPKCGARTRAKTRCQARVVPGKRRCRVHGGLSTGPKTEEGRERIREAQRRRWDK